jgi:hypothetical protein
MNSKETIIIDENSLNKNLPLEEDFDMDVEMDVEMILPTMNVSKELTSGSDDKECIVKDENLLGLYDEILTNCRDDRSKVDEILSTFLEMVINDGDASSASKEAIVNLMKIKSDTADKMSKVADLMTRLKLKDKDTFPRYLAAQQNNKVVIEGSKRDLLKSINKIANKKGKSNES